jgi:predicted  nucleic acid-binding Zn-ribbon protein
MVRNPLEVGESLRSRDRFPLQKSILLWSSYMLAAERDTRGVGRSFVAYDQLLADWRAVRDRIAATSGFTFPREPDAAAGEIEVHLDRRLRHHRAGAEEFYARGDIPGEVKTLYRLVLEATDGADINPREVDELETRLSQTEALIGSSLADLRGRVRSLTKDVLELNVAHAGAREQADSLADQLAKQAQAAASATVQYEGHVAQLYAHIAAVEADREGLRHEAEAERARTKAKEVEFDRLVEETERLRFEKAASDASMAKFERDLQALEEEIDFEIRAVELRASRRVGVAEAKRDELKAELDAERRRADGLDAEVQSLRREAERLRAKSTSTEAKLKTFVQGLDAIEDEVEEMIQTLELRVAERVQQAAAEAEASREQVRAVSAELDTVTAQLEQANATLNRFRGSVSWRLTRPVRWTARLFRTRSA